MLRTIDYIDDAIYMALIQHGSLSYNKLFEIARKFMKGKLNLTPFNDYLKQLVEDSLVEKGKRKKIGMKVIYSLNTNTKDWFLLIQKMINETTHSESLNKLTKNIEEKFLDLTAEEKNLLQIDIENQDDFVNSVLDKLNLLRIISLWILSGALPKTLENKLRRFQKQQFDEIEKGFRTIKQMDDILHNQICVITANKIRWNIPPNFNPNFLSSLG